MSVVSFEISDIDAALVSDILDRLETEYDFNRESLEMDLTACHANGNPMDFDGLLHADRFHFLHDLWGIKRHLNRETGKLENCFLPRYSKPQTEH